MSPRGEEQNRRMRSEAIEKITAAALEAFAEYGYHGVTMLKIMQMSGLSKGLIYHYFSSKEDVFLHLVKSSIELSNEAWEDAAGHEGTAWEKIKRLTENMCRVSFAEGNLNYLMIMLQAMTQAKGIPGLPELLAEQGARFDLLIPLIREAQQDGDVVSGNPEILYCSYYALFQGYILQVGQDRSLAQHMSPEVFLSVLQRRLA